MDAELENEINEVDEFSDEDDDFINELDLD